MTIRMFSVRHSTLPYANNFDFDGTVPTNILHPHYLLLRSLLSIQSWIYYVYSKSFHDFLILFLADIRNWLIPICNFDDCKMYSWLLSTCSIYFLETLSANNLTSRRGLIKIWTRQAAGATIPLNIACAVSTVLCLENKTRPGYVPWMSWLTLIAYICVLYFY